MNKQEIAAKLNGTQYGEIDPELVTIAREHNLVIITGSSDDIICVEGAIDDEFSEGKIVFAKAGEKVILEDDGDEFTGRHMRNDGALQLDDDSEITKNVVEGEFGQNGWEFKTELPHEKFEMFDGGELYGQGIVIDLNELIV